MTILNAQCSLKRWVSGLLPWMTPYSSLSYTEEPKSTKVFTEQEKLIAGSDIQFMLNYLKIYICEEIYMYIYTHV